MIKIKLLWITHRKFTDFCATTSFAFANGLIELGFNLTILNPEQAGSHNDSAWEHIGLETNALRGFQGRSFSKKALNHFESMEMKFDAYLLDWQVGVKVGKELAQHNRPVFLMDRSPPADRGILAKLQWNVWKNAWKGVKNGVFKSGFVVSNSHLRFVTRTLNVSATDITVLHAGVNPQSDLIPLTCEQDDVWKFVYHGQLDRHRGLLEFMKHIVAWNDIGISCHLTLIGEGDARSAIASVQAKHPTFFSLKEKMSHADVLAQLREFHIGILPMPATKVWKLASPLKRGEYLASGLIVVGIDHEGHRFDSDVGPWMQLHNANELKSKIGSFLHYLTPETYQECSQAAMEYAIQNLSWSTSIQRLADEIRGDGRA